MIASCLWKQACFQTLHPLNINKIINGSLSVVYIFAVDSLDFPPKYTLDFISILCKKNSMHLDEHGNNAPTRQLSVIPFISGKRR